MEDYQGQNFKNKNDDNNQPLLLFLLNDCINYAYIEDVEEEGMFKCGPGSAE